MSLVGVLPGAFDPVHNGQLDLAQAAQAGLELDEVRWVPAGMPPARSVPLATADDRVEMTRLAIERMPGFVLDDSEAKSNAPSHLVPMLERLRAGLDAGSRLLLILGADQLLALDRQKDWLSVFDLAHVAVAQRPGYSLDTATMTAMLRAAITRKIGTPDMARTEPAGRIIHFSMRQSRLTASGIRERLARGEDVTDAVPAAVAQFIKARGLYRAKPASG